MATLTVSAIDKEEPTMQDYSINGNSSQWDFFVKEARMDKALQRVEASPMDRAAKSRQRDDNAAHVQSVRARLKELGTAT